MPNDPIDNVRDDPLDGRELQETRYANDKVLREMVDPAEINKRHEQHDLMWWALGWVPVTAKNWKALVFVVVIAVAVGGQDFIDNVAKYLGGAYAMSGHTTFGAIVFSTALAGVLQLAGVITEPETGIQINDLTFVMSEGQPFILQDRTVTAHGTLTAHWATTVGILRGSKPELVCHGSGYWDYEAGELSAKILFDEWVGQSGCFDLIPEGSAYVLSAEYRWGDSGLERHRTAPIIKATEVTE